MTSANPDCRPRSSAKLVRTAMRSACHHPFPDGRAPARYPAYGYSYPGYGYTNPYHRSYGGSGPGFTFSASFPQEG